MTMVVVPFGWSGAQARKDNAMQHLPVMVDEVVRYLLHERTRVVMDGTVGFGGHAEAILSARPDIRLIGVDRDPAALEAAAVRLRGYADRVHLVRGLYSDFEHALAGVGKVDGVLLDLGFSSPQLDDPARGFAHSAHGPLDMRMDGEGETAALMLARLDVDQIGTLLRELGEVRQARRVARAIASAAAAGTLSTTSDLRAAVIAALGRGVAPAELSRVFQAVRIAINRELDALRAFLDGVLDVLNPGGRLVVLSYHSLEDRMVKTFLRDAAATCVCPPNVPVCVCGRVPRLEVLTRKGVRASHDEIAANPRARSATLRAAAKVSNGARVSGGRVQ
ncbi:MAG TPA: 16S rRNA (cytosine(1402)-N(4))-methyltransferase RsmH [Candidatus Krumholzibacteria bacterium]|nr:16S rRNA (cytosine(1402)-N(4))-methyltransferase RsmH [Candidatus Krumholzibacteria bacterium]